KFDLAIVNGTVVFPESGLSEVDIAVKDGRIAAILQRGIAQSLAAQTLDASGKYVFPGLIDAHIHFGFAEPVTEYTTETIYAAQGGFSTARGYFLNNEDYGGVFAREIQHASPLPRCGCAFHFPTPSY